MSIFAKIFGILDFLPGYKANSGLLIFVITSVLQLAGANQPEVELVKEVATALMAYGVAIKAARPIVNGVPVK